jgi:outer membrane protein assembly factor BamB
MDGTTFAASTAATDGTHVYAIFATGDVAAFTLDGKKAWSKNLGPHKNSYGYTSSLATFGGRVIVQYDDDATGRLIGLDGKTGQPAWDLKRESIASWASPAVVDTGGRVEILVASNPFVSGHDPMTGKPLWSLKCMKGETAPSPAFAGGVAYFVTDHAAMVAVQTGGDGKILWTFDEDLPDASSPVATETHVFMCSSAGLVTCLDAKTGKRAWQQEFEDGFYGSPVLVDDRIYVMDRSGTTHVFRASGEKFESLAKNPLGEKADCTPAVPDGRIYLRSEKFLYCMGKSGT